MSRVMQRQALLDSICAGTGQNTSVPGITQECPTCKTAQVTDSDGTDTWFVPHAASKTADLTGQEDWTLWSKSPYNPDDPSNLWVIERSYADFYFKTTYGHEPGDVWTGPSGRLLTCRPKGISPNPGSEFYSPEYDKKASKTALNDNIVWHCDSNELANALGNRVKDLVGQNTVKVDGTLVTFFDDVGIDTQTRLKLKNLQGGISTVAHDSGDGETIFHCPFCGSGQVIGRSDGTAMCDFCNTAFTVQVQPERPSQPQTINGNPVQMPGMPMGGDQAMVPGDPNAGQSTPSPGDPTDPSAAPDGASDGPPAPGDTGPGHSHPGDDKPADDGAKKPNPFAKGSARYYMTADGTAMAEDKYIAHLAIRFADDREGVVASVRAENERKVNNG